jgi:hypothetical protein
VLAHLPFYLVLFPLFLELVTQNAAFAALQAAKHLKRAANVCSLLISLIVSPQIMCAPQRLREQTMCQQLT